MIALTIPAKSDASARFVVRLNDNGSTSHSDAILVSRVGNRKVYSGRSGLFELTLVDEDVEGDVIVVDPERGLAERLIRRESEHNTLLVTERCDQLCVMCSQPPKKTHIDRWSEYRQAALLAPAGATIGLSGGEPTLFKEEVLAFIEDTFELRPDVGFHVLTNGQHFEKADKMRLCGAAFDRVTWGIPMYSATAPLHDEIVVKPGAHVRLRESLAILLEAGAHIELRTVVLSSNIADMPQLADYVATHMGFIDQWSIMQLENIGFAKQRFHELSIEPERDFDFLTDAIDKAELFGVSVALFNFPLCSVPVPYRRYAVRSISDWKQKYAAACSTCSAMGVCSGFFAWHPEQAMKVRPL